MYFKVAEIRLILLPRQQKTQTSFHQSVPDFIIPQIPVL